jgi:hypothetical protein
MDPAFDKSVKIWRLLAWVGAVVAMLVSFYHDWSIPVLGIDLRPKRGHLMMEGYEVIKWALIGSLVGGWWWNAAHLGRRSGAVMIVVWSVGGLAGWFSREVFWLGWLIWVSPAVVGAVVRLPQRWLDLKCFWVTPRPWNAWFWAVWFGVWVLCDAILLEEAPPGWLETGDAFLARFLTHAVITGAVALMLVWHDRWTPTVGRWLGWVVIMLTPMAVVINTGLRVWWGKGMMEMFGELEVGGRFEVERAWAAGGMELTTETVLLAIGVLLLTGVVFWACEWLSKRGGWQISPLQLGLISGGAWLALQADQLAGLAVKDRAWRWWERKAFHRRMTWVEPEPGMAAYQVEFANPRPEVTLPPDSWKPDVYLFFVESLRADTLTPEIAPFLTTWGGQECQPLRVTWAASNVTHQSWFSALSGRLPVFMEESRREKKLAPLPAMLKAKGYRVEVRLVNNFEYMDMVSGNFGEPLRVDVMEHVDGKSSENFFKVPEREVRMLRRLRQAVSERPEGGLFAITGMDSTHYNYKWGATFQPPFSDYEENPIFPMRPSTEQALRIKHRFWNSVSWVDSQLGEFVGWLKSQGRYDNSLIIVTGDHGEEFKEQGSWFHGTMLNEPQTRVPILIKWPVSLGVGRGPEVADASHLDLMPTMMDAFGSDPALWRGLPGISLLHPPSGPRTLVMSTHFCGRNGEALVLRREGVEAAFGWRNFWMPQVPEFIWLERVQGANVTDWQPAFSDAMDRLFLRVDSK